MVVATTVTYVTLTTRRKGATENREETHTHSQLTDHRRDGHGSTHGYMRGRGNGQQQNWCYFDRRNASQIPRVCVSIHFTDAQSPRIFGGFFARGKTAHTRPVSSHRGHGTEHTHKQLIQKTSLVEWRQVLALLPASAVRFDVPKVRVLLKRTRQQNERTRSSSGE